MCFSLWYIGQMVIGLIIILAIAAIVQRVLPPVLAKFGEPGEIASKVITIIFWAVVGIALVLVVVNLLSCLLGGGIAAQQNGTDPNVR